jgi:hypothetical protein
MVGTFVQCPQCGQTTELLLQQPPDEPLIPRKVVVWTLATVLILLIGFGGAVLALKWAQKWSEERKTPEQHQRLPR